MIQLEQGESVTDWLNKQTLENRVLSCYIGFAFDLLHELGKSLCPRAAKPTGEIMCHRYLPLHWQRPSYKKGQTVSLLNIGPFNIS